MALFKTAYKIQVHCNSITNQLITSIYRSMPENNNTFEGPAGQLYKGITPSVVCGEAHQMLERKIDRKFKGLTQQFNIAKFDYV